MQAFREVLADCRLKDVIARGPMTWLNKRHGNEAVKERLDRMLINSVWHKTFQTNKVEVLDFYGSDHRPMLLRGTTNSTDTWGKRRRRFYFEEKWLHDADFVPDFLNKWEQLKLCSTLPDCLKECQTFLTSWAGNRFDNLGKRIKDLRKQRVQMMKTDTSKNKRSQWRIVDKEIERLTDLEETHWKMRARTNWLSQGDKNTTTFHAYASGRRKKNMIQGLEDERGNWKTNDKDKVDIMSRHFSNLFTSTNPHHTTIKEAVQPMSGEISEEDIKWLDRSFTRDEVERAMFDMHPTKTPGPDGFHARFFQKLWPEIGSVVTSAALAILNEGADLSEWNKTLLIFIPKVGQPRRTGDFRPLSLCNTTYKLVSKVVVNRIRKVIGNVVDQNQSAFLPGRQITDNIIVGFECMHWIRQRRGKSSGFAALKLDMSKAYDRVEWNYVEAVLAKLKFPESITRLILRCISTVRYSMVINGNVYGNITPTRGLRQGDPLSPLLFVLCAQGLSSMLHKLQMNNRICGVQFAGEGPIISHLLFADDSLLFFKAEVEGARSIKECLKLFEQASGQSVNYEKSAITFSSNTPSVERESIQKTFNIQITEGHAIYLGLPTFSKRNKRMQFGFLRERVIRKLETWKNKHLSTGGKEVLIKAVVQAIPNYTMACFKVPEAICSDIDRACARFWWGDTEEKHKMHWRKWEALCKPKERGGLGFRRIASVNKAMLAKQIWRCLKNPELLVARVLKAKYYQSTDILEAKVKSNASYIWRSICGSRNLIKKGLRWKIGRNSKKLVNNTAFVPNLASGIPCARRIMPPELRVKELMKEDGKQWDTKVIDEYYGTAMKEEIIKVQIGREEGDIMYWKFDERGNYSAKTGYLTEIGYYESPQFQQAYDKKEWSRLVWNLKLPPKVKMFLWRMINDLIPLAANLVRHHVPMSGCCEFCYQFWGTTTHCLFSCTKIKKVWKTSIYWDVIKRHKHGSMMELTRDMREKKTKDEFEVWVMTSWRVWRALCQQKHEPDGEQIRVSVAAGRDLVESYREANRATKQRWFFGIPVGIKIWKPPIQGVYRVDVDACFNERTLLFGVGIVIRNNMKEVCAAMALPISNPGSVVEAELLALMYGAGLCLQERLGPVVMFSDSLNAVRTIARMRKGEDEMLTHFEEVVTLMSEGVILDICHMYREANCVAHALARFGALSSSLICWTSELPNWLREVVRND